METQSNVAQVIEAGIWNQLLPTTVIPVQQGMRFVEVRYKNMKGKKAERSNVFVGIVDHINAETIKSDYESLLPHFIDYLKSVEDEIVKEKHRKGESRIYPEYLNMGRIIDKLNADANGGRLSAEKIKAWFDSEILDTIILTCATKMGITGDFTPEQEGKINVVASAYLKKFESLGSGKTVLSENDRNTLKGVIELAEAGESHIGAIILKRIADMNNDNNELFNLL